MGNKNAEISTKSSEIICLLKDKILIDLFQTNTNIEDLFSDSNNTLIIDKNYNLNHSINYRKHSINSSSNFKNQRQIIEEIGSLIANKNNMFQNSQIDHNDGNVIIVESLSESEKCLQKDYFNGFNYTYTTKEVKTHKFSKNEFINDQHEKDKITIIFNEIKDKYFQKKEIIIQPNDVINNESETVYAMKLDKDQIYTLFSKFFEENSNNNEELFDFLTKGKILFKNDNLLGLKRERKKQLEKSFYIRRGICQQLSKILNKIVIYIIT